MLHCCYVCSDVDGVVAELTLLGLRERMRTEVSTRPGSLLGMPGDVTGMAAFLYDERGPRVAPAIEVHGWIDPPATGVPFAEPHHVGFQAIGISVPDLDAAVAAVESAGGQVDTTIAVTGIVGRSTVVRDGRGVTFDLVHDPGEPSHLRHVRISCSDLDRSLSWYEQVGFARISEADEISVGTPTMTSITWQVRVARLRLPDEPTELLLTEWLVPRAFGAHYRDANHLGLFRIALGVDDTRAGYEQAIAAGWRFHAPPINRLLGGTNIPDMWIAMTRDPDGVPIEFVERPRSAFGPRPNR
jgi:catechol 2,3-dioxygenase-like lactoylglutathione lyase family enzyme